MKEFTTSIAGRLRNFHLPSTQPLIPLYEAIVNSFQALEERKKLDPSFKNPYIDITIERDLQIKLLGIDKLNQIDNMVIKDNGIGFNERNLESFAEFDSLYKASIGGKGVGRFSWLKAFEKVEVESIYMEGSHYVKREFQFNQEKRQIDDTLADVENATDNCTKVRLEHLNGDYRDAIPKNIETIAMKIIQHCLIYFIAEDCPSVTLNDGEDSISLNEIFKEKISSDANSEIITVNSKKFKLLHVKVEDPTMDGHKIFLCANNRVVLSEELDKFIVDLDRPIYQNEKFWYLGLVTSDYFDDNVDMNRLSFSIPISNPPNSLIINNPSMHDIINALCERIELYLKPFLDSIRDEKNKRIKNYVTNEAPQFRHLLKYKSDDIAKIKPNLSKDKLDDELHRIKRSLDKEIKKGNDDLFNKLNKGAIDYDEYDKNMKEQIEKINDANSAVLAEYIAHRKVIINLMEFGINKKEDGKFNKEKYLHNIIYPMHTDSDITNYASHNLWLIDERLSYCTYICSDIPFNNNPEERRPDILILDQPVAVSEDKNDGTEFDSIVLFELKRPMRDDYGESDNPITQLLDYVDKIKSGTVKDKNGRPIKAGDNTKFYLYVVCDVLSKMERFIKQRGLRPTPDGLGYYYFNDVYNAMIEVLPYDKIIIDSKKRNQILFDKLGI